MQLLGPTGTILSPSSTRTDDHYYVHLRNSVEEMMAQKRSRRQYEADLRKQEAPFVLYGTPLPVLDENARDDGSYVPIWKQEVTDDHGRKRLHGAFTGGFSAGYFNTVGSKDGWTPSTFVSSRSNRARDDKTAKTQTIEDFMDDEDIKEREDAQHVSTSDGYAGFGTTDAFAVQGKLDEILRPTDDSMGERLLNRMGWKKGQGIGPRVIRKIDPGDPESELREFPPEDSVTLEFSQKQDYIGLGYGGNEKALSQRPSTAAYSATNGESDNEDGRPGLSFMNGPKTRPKKLLRSGIGIGSLNDTGSDDDDFYEMGPKVSYSRVLGGDKRANKSKSVTITPGANPRLKSKPVFVSKSKQLPSTLNSLRKCHDGKLPLAGFVLADELDSFTSMSLSEAAYQPPDVPEAWEPESLNVSTGNGTASPRPISNHHLSTPDLASRRTALAESSLPSKSVFDYLSPAARDRLASATNNPSLPPALNEAPPITTGSSELESTNLLPYSYLEPSTASTALERLRNDKKADAPYAQDLPKQGRYKDFLRYSVDPLPPPKRVPPLRAPHHKSSNDDHLAEIAEFAATAEIFKPTTGFLASRFAAAGSSLSAANLTGLGPEPARDVLPGTEELVTKPAKKSADPAEEAARMGMFGIATRSTKSWMPTRLLCKRFGVDMPVGLNEK